MNRFLKQILRPFISLIPVNVRIWLVAKQKGISFQAEKRRRVQREKYWKFHIDNHEKLMLSISNYAFVNRPIDGYYMEFGCCSAVTMRLAWDNFHWIFPEWKFIAFDSFEGFPEIQDIDRQEIWKKGKSSMDEQKFISCLLNHGIPLEKFSTVKGFYDTTLTSELQQKLLPTKAAVVYVDCDLYASTVPVLQFIVPFLQRGTVIVFDEWNAFWGDPDKGERRAFREFQEENPSWTFEPFVSTNMAQSFICVPKE